MSNYCQTIQISHVISTATFNRLPKSLKIVIYCSSLLLESYEWKQWYPCWCETAETINVYDSRHQKLFEGYSSIDDRFDINWNVWEYFNVCGSKFTKRGQVCYITWVIELQPYRSFLMLLSTKWHTLKYANIHRSAMRNIVQHSKRFSVQWCLLKISSSAWIQQIQKIHFKMTLSKK